MHMAAVDERTTPHGRKTHLLPVQRFLQPDDVTCGPTCLRKVYDFYGLDVEAERVLTEIDRNEDGGTLGVFLGVSALARGFGARIYSYNLRIFDPTWAGLSGAELAEKLRARLQYLSHPKATRAGRAYLQFVESGGELCFDELNPALLKRILDRDHPVLVGLSATYLYGMARERFDEINDVLVDDDIGGDPIGHFLVVAGYEQWGRRFLLLDPHPHSPHPATGPMEVDAQRLVNSILLGDLTYDAVLLELWPGESRA
jgi:hypothetical protein